MPQATKILAVDDEELVLDILQDSLDMEGFSVVTATNGVEALERLKEHPDFDVIVLDRMMPEMDGMEVVKHVREHPEWHKIPIIMQTAAATAEQVEEGMNAGVYYYLVKPYKKDQLISIIRSVVTEGIEKKKTLDQLGEAQPAPAPQKQTHKFRTFEEVHHLASQLATYFPDPETTLYGLHELMLNAVEHGNLGITSNEKKELVLEGGWQDEVARRVNLPENKDKYATIDLEITDNEFIITIRDMGKGFDWKKFIDFSPERFLEPSGRGIAIAKSMAFPDMEYRGAGNEVVCRQPRYTV